MFDCQSIQQSARADAGLPITCVRMVRKDIWQWCFVAWFISVSDVPLELVRHRRCDSLFR
jgi:hypothetical protein